MIRWPNKVVLTTETVLSNAPVGRFSYEGGFEDAANRRSIFQWWRLDVRDRIHVGDRSRHYSRAIHSDLGLVRKFVQKEGNKILSCEDINDDPEQLIEYTLTLAADINKLFQNYYK